MNNKDNKDSKDNNINNNDNDDSKLDNDNNLSSLILLDNVFYIMLNVFKQLFLFIGSGNLFHTDGQTYERHFCPHFTFWRRNVSLS